MSATETFFALPGRALLQVIQAQERAVKSGDFHLANNFHRLGSEIATLIREAAGQDRIRKEKT